MKPSTIAISILAAAFLLGGAAAFPTVARVATLRHANPQMTPFMADGRTALQQWVSLGEIAAPLQRAVVVAEDPRFFRHRGVDAWLVLHSLRCNLALGRTVRGGSTITMQLAKNLFFGPERTWARKAKEVAIALAMEALLSKERILELYLNVAEWGPGVFGAEMAARHHFSKSASALTNGEAAYLASILPNPRLISSPLYRARFARAQARIEERLGHP